MADKNKKNTKKWNPTYKKKFAKSDKSIPNRSRNTTKEFSSKYNSEWKLYFPEKYSPDDASILIKLRVAENYLTLYPENMLINIDKNKHFSVDIDDILKDDQFKVNWAEFKNELENSPEFVIGLFGLAMEHLIKKNNIRDPTDPRIIVDGNFYDITPKINPRFIGLRNILSFQDLKTYNIGRFVTVMGIIVRTSDVKPFCTEMAFMCLKCQTTQVCTQEKGCYTPPSRCDGSECFSSSFKPLLTSPLTQTVPWKTVRVQELNINQTEGGRVPRTIECELMYELTDTCVPGDIVLMSGVISLNNANEKKTTASKDACTYVLFLSVNSVTCLKGKNAESSLTDSLYLQSEELNIIKQIQSQGNLFRLVVASLAPNIYGHELIKAGLILALFGGGESSKEDTSQFSTRENSHVLIVGDPGLGKSQMLLASSSVSPRGVYVCGNSTTTSGLTVTITKEAGGDNTLEAGALVLADQGHCCIDEFDKMMHQHSALLEAMEQQTISMAKSGVVCTLPARTSIIAVANPSGGHYNRAKTVLENLKIGGSVLSRFDLVFIIQDRPDQSFDSKMSEHVMARHNENPNRSVNLSEHLTKSTPSISESLSSADKLSKKLQMKGNENINSIPHKMLQKYISYARKFSQPELPPEVCKLLQSFYLEMRKHRKLNYSTPITTRQLESLVRLTRARTRVEMRQVCTTSDAEDVIEIMKYSMKETFSDEFGNIDLERSTHGSGMSKRSQSKKFMSHLTEMAEVKGDNCFLVAEMKEIANRLKIPPNSFSSMLETLNDQGFLLKKGFQLYEIQTL